MGTFPLPAKMHKLTVRALSCSKGLEGAQIIEVIGSSSRGVILQPRSSGFPLSKPQTSHLESPLSHLAKD